MSKSEVEGAKKVHIFLVSAIRWLVVSFSETDMGMGLVIKTKDFNLEHILFMCP